jgi:IS5 family transposase
MGRSYLAHRSGGANNAVLAAVGYNFRLLLNWLRLLWLQIWIALWVPIYIDQGVFGG